MVAIGILIYLGLTLAVGFWAGRSHVQNSEDFLLAGRRLGLPIATATVFATWFGAESILGASTSMAEEGLLGVIVEPFGAAMCLILVGVFYARPIYRMNLLTIGDFYRRTYGPLVETVSSVFLVLSFLGWVGGQFVALGVLVAVVFGLSVKVGMFIGFIIVVSYTIWGGMWAVALLDFVQNFVIIIGLLLVVGWIWGDVDWSWLRLQLPPDYLDFFPKGGTVSWLNYLAAWITIGLGSIPGQDIYQRVMSSRNERVAVASAWLAGLLYLTVGMLPLLLATYLRVYQPDLVFGSEDPQRAIPEFVLSSMPPWVALLFLGALFSAVLSTASGGLLAPAAIVSENLIGARLPKYRNGAVPLWLTRVCVLGIALLSLLLGGWQGNIHHLVAESSALSLVSLFAILTLGLFARRAPSPLAALASMVSGMLVYGLARWVATDINPLIYGFVSSWLAIWTVEFWTPKQATVSQ